MRGFIAGFLVAIPIQVLMDVYDYPHPGLWWWFAVGLCVGSLVAWFDHRRSQ